LFNYRPSPLFPSFLDFFFLSLPLVFGKEEGLPSKSRCALPIISSTLPFAFSDLPQEDLLHFLSFNLLTLSLIQRRYSLPQCATTLLSALFLFRRSWVCPEVLYYLSFWHVLLLSAVGHLLMVAGSP